MGRVPRNAHGIGNTRIKRVACRGAKCKIHIFETPRRYRRQDVGGDLQRYGFVLAVDDIDRFHCRETARRVSMLRHARMPRRLQRGVSPTRGAGLRGEVRSRKHTAVGRRRRRNDRRRHDGAPLDARSGFDHTS